MLGRELAALAAYDESRRPGEKHIVALASGVDALHRDSPEFPISVTEMRGILARWRGKNKETVLPEREVLQGAAAKPYLQGMADASGLQANQAGDRKRWVEIFQRHSSLKIKITPSPIRTLSNSEGRRLAISMFSSQEKS
jgi:hypothetical protein